MGINFYDTRQGVNRDANRDDILVLHWSDRIC